ncbi:MAG: diphthine--ammonia ligase [Methanotrichaceae archaeon]|nr:diphthine--ammonia ligase [Methanotrichaceae archaeon]
MIVNLGALFSGGKDSVFACHRAMEKNRVICLITMISENPASYMFHTPNIRWTNLQADAIGIPGLPWFTKGEKETELKDLKAAIRFAQDRFGIEGIVTGAIESVYQAARIQIICQDLDIWCFNPLWQINQIEYLRMLLLSGFKVIITGVFAYPFDASWVGAFLSEKRIRKLIQLQEEYKINPSGEGGELETFVLDGPIFRKRIEIVEAAKSYENFRGHLIFNEMRLVDK